ncbi:MAG TPA: DUF1573 domain-containing protein, partial [Saprospiraceae bacterium]|nr:DUF1573 domain-containing protein [Saprospiraceae bacterium]
PATSKMAWLTERDHDFGEIPQGRPVKFVFRYRNTSDAPLTLETVRTTCGCTAAEWTEGPVPPGGTGDISVEYDAYQGGTFKKKIRVFFHEQKKAEMLSIRGEVD